MYKRQELISYEKKLLNFDQELKKRENYIFDKEIKRRKIEPTKLLPLWDVMGVALGFGTTAYFITTMRLGSGKASSFMFIVPFSAVISSSIFLGEVIALTTVIGGFFAIMAVYIINK